MFELLGTVLTGGATGIIGSVIGKAFSFLDSWQEEKKAGADHQRTLEMLEMQNKMGAEESERELAVAEVHAWIPRHRRRDDRRRPEGHPVRAIR